MSEQLGIVELSRVCAEMRVRSMALFEELGRWVPDTADGELQRLFAEACHRHAWHADLWVRRAPTVPAAADIAAQPLDARGEAGDDEARRRSYRERLVALDDELRRLRGRIDPTLDPGSARTIDLVGRDVAELIARLEPRRPR